MAKRGGFNGMGMPGNMNNLMKQAQKMQQKMQENQRALEEKIFEASAGGGAVTVKMSGKREITALEISPDAVDPDDVETLQDLITAAFNEVMKKIDEESAQQLGSLTGGLGGGLF
ncbi:MAG: YbaB/EbfC family nucleoid-associated protein [Lachnospiraceae bacterium]|nr:YbaB/EbfC family nucleoid-associated protein [Lachnospiraceae bacterium]